MADHTQTVTNSVNCFGGSPASSWNSHNWGAFLWGEGTEVTIWHLEHELDSSALATTEEYWHDPEKVIGESVSGTTEFTDLLHQDGTGYYRVYPSGVSDADDRSEATWSSSGSTTTSWTRVSAPSTSWT